MLVNKFCCPSIANGIYAKFNITETTESQFIIRNSRLLVSLALVIIAFILFDLNIMPQKINIVKVVMTAEKSI